MKGFIASVVAAGVFGALYFQCGSAEEQKRPGDKYLMNRVWADKKTSDPRTLTFRLALVDKAKQRVGLIAHTSMWRLYFELFRFQAKKNELVLELPQDGRRVTMKYRTWRCKDAPKPFDLCLELSHEGRKMRLYSRQDAIFNADQSLDYLMEGELSGFAQWPGDAELLEACTDCQEGVPAWLEPWLDD